MTSSTQTQQLKAGSWALDAHHSSVAFTIRHLGIAKVRGGFTRFATEFVVDETGAASLSATIELDSFDTGNPDRDAHVRNADFLDVANRPTLSFRSTQPVTIGESFTVVGEATLGTVTRPLTFDVEWGGIADFPDGTRHAGFSATGTIKRTDFGVGGPMPGMLADKVAVELEIELVEPA
ncbi:YceI family protein [Nocardia sp. NPDC004415]